MRWRKFHNPALRWVAALERRIGRLGHPDNGAFMSLTNALEYQFEAGADPDTVLHLVRALIAFAAAVNLGPADLGILPEAEEIVHMLAPRRSRGRKA